MIRRLRALVWPPREPMTRLDYFLLQGEMACKGLACLLGAAVCLAGMIPGI